MAEDKRTERTAKCIDCLARVTLQFREGFETYELHRCAKCAAELWAKEQKVGELEELLGGAA